MQISQEVAKIALEKLNRRPFILLTRLKMEFSHGWVAKTPEEIGQMFGLSESTIRRRLHRLIKLGYVEEKRTNVYFLHNLNKRDRPWTEKEKRLIKLEIITPNLSTVKLTKEMSDEEIFAHLAAKVAAKYCRECEFIYKVKKDNELMHDNKPLQTFDNEKTVARLYRKHSPVSSLPNKKIVISDKKMALRLGINTKDFRRNVKPYWRAFGIMLWGASLVQLPISQNQMKYGEIGVGVFIHKGHAYTHTTEYINIPKL
jgi:DNA-binding Lrp family transcriptional regulator